MVIRIKKDTPALAIREALTVIANQLKSASKGFDPKKYVGKTEKRL